MIFAQLTGDRGARRKLRRFTLSIATAVLLLSPLSIAVGRTAPSALGGTTRTYYIAAEEVAWDYAPSGRNLITDQPFTEAEQVFVKRGPHRIGHVYRKAVYRAYTDETFATPVSPDPRWEHLGMLGPVIRAEVGDTLIVVFKNNTGFPNTVHPHGVFYEKDSEGAPYADGTSELDKEDDAVPPGGIHTYTWRVPERAGPGPSDPSSIVWLYHSHTDEVADTNAGLIGPIIITRKGEARADGSPKDVDREFVTLYSVIDENQSPYLDDNLRSYAEPNDEGEEHEDEEFAESNLMHGINGYVYGNLPGLRMQQGEHVRWYVLGMGTEVDLHTPHWHAQTVTWMGHRADMVNLLPGGAEVVDMVPDNPGTWLMHCHVNDHIAAGMLATFTVD
jgi:FtsP/CotA-like multicopper oxidase with cupredoxin domain